MTEVEPESGGIPAAADLAIDPAKRLTPQVALRIREMIMSGEAPGNSPLRTEHLAARFGVSATPVREALMSLSGEGLVELRPGRGFRVVQMSRQDFIDIYDAQAYFAGELAGRAALHLTDEEVEQLYAMQAQIIEAIERGDKAAERIEWELHTLINRAARANKLRWLLRLTIRHAPFRAWSSVTGWAQAAPEDHLPLLRAMRNRNPRTARDAMTAHIRNVGELLADHLTERGILVDDPVETSEIRTHLEGIAGLGGRRRTTGNGSSAPA
ncbi:MAG TPA: GntR family transcriptional regulator [Pseudonocardia sp.]|uniref:GntR family transcriptional regulator n=1 Tax=Pseudonocardia sp. TaxID=60912 RepID=UPI002B4AD192|nr:GntR family transcriptional regulator [Pseudonocardia sp.]HLU56881.1 GntR family transcriptional regulator [Pseudonocardia sp.]